MSQLTVLEGKYSEYKKEEEERTRLLQAKKQKRYERYREIFWDSYSEDGDDIAKRIFSGVKYVIAYDLKKEAIVDEIQRIFLVSCIVEDLIGMVSLKEFMNIFPIGKEYDGEKYGMKDYYSTKSFLNRYEQKSEIGKKIEELLLEYYNRDIIAFNVKRFMLVDQLRRARGQKSMAEEFMEMYPDVETFHLDTERNTLVSNKTGEEHKVTPVKDGPKLKLLE